MKLNKKFNTLSFNQYQHIIANHKKYTDFNTLGLYRSIHENEKLSMQQKIQVRDLANEYFQKTFEFLQIKDPHTYIALQMLGQELTTADVNELWEELFKNQAKILKDKRIKHRNFGTYSKHNCGIEGCALNGVMVRQGSYLSEATMCIGNRDKHTQKQKSNRIKAQRRSEAEIIENERDLE